MVRIFIVFFMLFNLAYAFQVRTGEHKQFYRFVFETGKKVHFEEIPFLDQKVVVLSIEGKPENLIMLKDKDLKKYIKAVDIIKSGDTTKFVFELSDDVSEYKIFTLKKPFRIVIDFIKGAKVKGIQRIEKRYDIDIVKSDRIKTKKVKLIDDPIFSILTKRDLEIEIPESFVGDKKIVVIDPGHGGRDPGAIHNGLVEKDVNLKIAKRLKKIIEKDPRFKVYLTREDDRFVSLYKRTVFAVKKRADIFISIHCNSSPTLKESGTYIYTLNLRGARSKLAKLVEMRENKAVVDYVRVSTNPVVNRIVADLAISSTMTEGLNFAKYLKRYLKDVTDFRDIDSANFAVLKTPGIPSVLIETLYLTDPLDAYLLKNDLFIENFSLSVYNAIVDYFFEKK
ncbi:MAG TPA: N-acetylmuramoyl-L-alanine amidase [Persephonella sp.]|uniref:N-acetylmuramoyl-L-alanine amidase n=1 Tax=Persephonella marina (strain DSM 14350 / EX-H1) TaxID=123214 RepID=C0QU75_PERMH|nr:MULTISPECIES: N-acetylmuramoyl-L-alanine amidase [Persephonella]ACO04048.1 N-acetylmuramoyl-L-alanine amidase [Persephonella marina EX-H1]HCB70144.1 N-acetylmuramoyl-L-alanine amidase [Persephonella sp.]